MKETYRLAAQRAGIRWEGRRYDRANPNAADLPNQALNHAASAVEAAAAIACAAVGAIPQLGFIHEDPGQSLLLDVSDLFRDSVTIPVAFAAARDAARADEGIERLTRRQIGRALAERSVIPQMIDRLKQLFEAADPEAVDNPPPKRRQRPGGSTSDPQPDAGQETDSPGPGVVPNGTPDPGPVEGAD